MKETVDSLTELIRAVSEVFRILGPVWSVVLAVAVLGGLLWLHYWRSRVADRNWERLVDAKNSEIDRLNEQNREARVQILVLGGLFTKQEAVKLVYREDILESGPESGTEPRSS